jgi:hypothetical protein
MSKNRWLGRLGITLIGAGIGVVVAMGTSATAGYAHPPDQPSGGSSVARAHDHQETAVLPAGLERAPAGVCGGHLRTIKTKLCTHGPDPAPPGFDVHKSRQPLSAWLTDAPRLVQCVGNGSNGLRTQVIYARASDVTDRFNTVRDTLRQRAEDADAIFNASAAETGGSRHIRFVHDSNCNVSVARANMDQATDDDNYNNTTAELVRLGFNRTDRNYLVFVDASVAGMCGQGNIKNDDQAGPDNANNGGPNYSLVWCWNGGTAAHELMHNIGGVQLSAPNSTGGWHCIDDNDLMCYDDSDATRTSPPIQVLCPAAASENRFDCNDDDYYNTNPQAGNYLRSNWNTANSLHLTGGARWGYVWADQPSSSSYTPFASYQRNSSGAPSTITRSGTGAYTVRFTNLGGSNGIVNVSAYDSWTTNMCKVSSWTTSGSNREAGVRCFTNTGAAVDSLFTASYTRPLNNPGDFGYVRADQSTTASYTPASDLRFNSTGGTNTVTRASTGNYTVRMPGLGARVGGTVLVTAFGTDSKTCKVVGWSSSGSALLITAQCHNAAGSASDSKFTITYSNQISTLGVTGAKAGYLWADNPVSASYTPFAPYQFNSTGATNTVTRNGTGDYTVHLPGLSGNNGHVQVTAYGTGSERCKVGSWGDSGSGLDAHIRCFTPAGSPVDTLYTVSYTR